MTTKVMVSFPDEFLAEIDQVAQEEQRSRSELLREAVRLYLQQRHRRVRPGDIPKVRRAIEFQDALARIAPGTGEDSTGEIRHWREARQ
jgi:Arc/MetJ-type ribon-helix-helix transcriptional regulator